MSQANMNRIIFSLCLALTMIGCAPAPQVKHPNPDAWVEAPVEALDRHSHLVAMPMFRALTDDGIEIRNYSDEPSMAICVGRAGTPDGTLVDPTQFVICTNERSTCSNLFYLKDRKVLKYKQKGRCGSDDNLVPETS